MDATKKAQIEVAEVKVAKADAYLCAAELAMFLQMQLQSGISASAQAVAVTALARTLRERFPNVEEVAAEMVTEAKLIAATFPQEEPAPKKPNTQDPNLN